MPSNELPKELRQLVRNMTDDLGQVIQEFEGEAFFKKVESYRIQLKDMRLGGKPTQLQKLLDSLKTETKAHQLKLAHSFSLLMELINVCEASYRTWRLQQRPRPKELEEKSILNFVLTSHPTEARSPRVVETLSQISDLLVSGLRSNFQWDEMAIKSKIRFLWQIPLSKQKKPTVQDEADFVFSLVLNERTLSFLLRENSNYELRLRTWVGGDKDGHPGVDEKVMQDCLKLSRGQILRFIGSNLEALKEDVRKLGEKTDKLSRLKKEASSLRLIREGDAAKVARFQKNFKSFVDKAGPYVGKHESTQAILHCFENFPALVLAIELREDREVIANALKDPDQAIAKMLKTLKQISKGGDLTWYAKGLVISHCETPEDISNAQTLAQKYGNALKLPIVPLFESGEALVNSKKILSAWLDQAKNLKQVQECWDNKLEVMLGYSDSAKQTGVLASRRLIQKSMHAIEQSLTSFNIQPIFFHGSGGSVARGGGSLREQITWWPDSAIERPKMTIQGEMIQRTFATQEILNSQAMLMSAEAQKRKLESPALTESKSLDLLMQNSMGAYRNLVEDPERLGAFLSATPFEYLDVLKIGSRPAKRRKGFSLDSLRAIPWVLCWTQTRLLLPTWWGVGPAWQEMTDSQKSELKELFNSDSFFSSYVKTLGFTMAKVEPEVWEMYLRRVHGDKANELSQEFYLQIESAKNFVLEVTGTDSLLWYRPWLEESIHLRAPYIHILNMLQIIAMEKGDEELLRKTLVGIASGMLTTG